MRQHLGQPKQIWVAEWSIFWSKLTSTLWFYNQLCKFFEKKEITWYCMHDIASYLEHAQSIWKTTQSVMLYNNQSCVRVNTMQIELYVRLAEVKRLLSHFHCPEISFLAAFAPKPIHLNVPLKCYFSASWLGGKQSINCNWVAPQVNAIESNNRVSAIFHLVTWLCK